MSLPSPTRRRCRVRLSHCDTCLKPAYAKARLLYLVGLLVMYALLVLPGPSMVGRLGGPGPKEGTLHRKPGPC